MFVNICNLKTIKAVLFKKKINSNELNASKTYIICSESGN